MLARNLMCSLRRWHEYEQYMNHRTAPSYPEQFTTTPDLLHVVIPRAEIVAEMTVRGEHETLNDVCLAVAMVADVIGTAQMLAAAE